MDLSWTVDRSGDASLVRCRVRNDGAVPRRVRIESRFDAPVLPPRRAGVPADGWDASGVTLRIGSGARRGFGFAVPAPPVDPPVAIADVEPIEPDEADETDESGRGIGSSRGDADSTPADALRDLADHRPPRAAVDGYREIDGDPGRTGSSDLGDGGNDAVPSEGPRDSGRERGEVECDADESGRAAPDALGEWFAAVEARIARAERLTDADLATATEAVADAGGVDALADLDDRVDADAGRLRAVSERAASLAERAEATDVPVGALERLA